MKQPIVSVITPVYNVEQYLRECLDGLVVQSYEKLEIILIDDGSTDKSPTICNEYSKKDRRVKVVHQVNKGVSGARNSGLSIASGDYLLFVDADDVVSADLVQTLLDGFTDESIGMTVCGFTKISSASEFHPTDASRIFHTLNVEETLTEIFYGDRIGSGPFCKMMKIADIRGIDFDEKIKIGEDLDFLVSALLVNEHWRVNHTKTSLYGYRMRKGSAMGSGYAQKDMDYLDIVRRRGDEVKKRYPSIDVAVAYRIFGVASYCVGRMKKGAKFKKSDLDSCNKELEKYSRKVLVNHRTSLKDRIIALAYSISVSLASRLRGIG